jgi:hypothetical protein
MVTGHTAPGGRGASVRAVTIIEIAQSAPGFGWLAPPRPDASGGVRCSTGALCTRSTSARSAWFAGDCEARLDCDRSEVPYAVSDTMAARRLFDAHVLGHGAMPARGSHAGDGIRGHDDNAVTATRLYPDPSGAPSSALFRRQGLDRASPTSARAALSQRAAATTPGRRPLGVRGVTSPPNRTRQTDTRHGANPDVRSTACYIGRPLCVNMIHSS